MGKKQTRVAQKYYPMLIIIGLNIKYFREQKGLSQEKLSDLTDIDEKTISRIESRNNPYSMSLNALFLIAEALEVSIEKLFEVRKGI